MNKKGIVLPAAFFISILYIPGINYNEPLTAIISYIPFIAGILFSFKNKDILWLIITGQILVINNNSIISSLTIELVLVTLFLIICTQGEKSKKYSVIAGFLIIITLFAYLAVEIQIGVYTFLCIIASITGYLLLEIRWRRIKRKITEG
jgi:hypothetical protein